MIIIFNFSYVIGRSSRHLAHSTSAKRSDSAIGSYTSFTADGNGQLSVNDLIYPLFVMEGEGKKLRSTPCQVLPLFLDLLLREVQAVFELY